LLLVSCLIALKAQPLCTHPCDIEMPFISSAMECSPSDCPDCHFIIDYKYREGWCDYDGDGNQEYIREIFLSNFQMQNCPETCWNDLVTAKDKYQFAVLCFLKNHRWNLDSIQRQNTWCSTNEFWTYIRNNPCGKDTLLGNTKNFTFCYNNNCCIWKYKLQFFGEGEPPYNIMPISSSENDTLVALKLENRWCNITFQCPNTNLCRLCYCDFSLNGEYNFEQKTNIINLNQYKKNIILTLNENNLKLLLTNYSSNTIKIEIYNLMGTNTFNKDIFLSSSFENINIAISLNLGIYFYRICDDKKNIISYGKLLIVN